MKADLYDAIESVLAADGSCTCDREALRRLWLRDRASLALNVDSDRRALYDAMEKAIEGEVTIDWAAIGAAIDAYESGEDVK